MLKTLSALTLSALAALSFSAAPALAQDGSFSLDLNNARAVENGCRLTYVAKNNTGAGLDKVSYEVAVFDKDSIVTRLLILEFGTLLDGKTKVVQFDLADQPCENISRLLINNVAECTAADGAATDCMSGLATSSRTEIEFGI